MKTKELLTIMSIMLVTTMTAQTNRLDSRALWASINGVKNASLGDYQTHTGKVLVTWRMLPSDDANTSFDLYRTIGTGAEQLIASDIKATNYQDNSANKSSDNTYRLTYAGRNETIGTYTLKQAQVSNGLPYISIPLKDTKDVYANTDKIVYTANDVSVGDLDGDGEYEIVVKRLQSVKDANGNIISDGSGASYSQQDCLYAVIWDAYKLDGTFLWRIKGGPGIILGNSSAFAIADFDGDGCAEMAIRTCEGTVFGDGTAIGDTNGDGKIDYRTWGNLNSSSPGWGDHYNCAGPEFISVIDGKTGRELARDNFINRETSQSWGDDYWKRACSFRVGIGCFDNTGLPSIILGRGVYAHSVIEAWDYRNGNLTKRWRFDTNDNKSGKDGNPYSAYAAQGNHSFNVADLDGDGLDEVMYGSMAVDHDGVGLWTTKLGHGDANHVGKFLPNRDGLQMYHCLETGKTMVALHDAKDGKVIWKKEGAEDNDVGRCLVADIDPNSSGCEFWWYGSNAHSQDGATDLGYKPTSCNMAIWFDGTLSRQLINENIIHSPANGRTFTMYRYSETFINGTKSNPSWYGDILGDWREEVILPDATRLQDLKIFSTWYPTTHRFPWLMTDHTYWMSALNENIGYNQPTNVGYYLGSDLQSDEEAWNAAKDMMNSGTLDIKLEASLELTDMVSMKSVGTAYPEKENFDYYMPVVSVKTSDTNGLSTILSGTFTAIDGTTTSLGSGDGEIIFQENYENRNDVSDWKTQNGNLVATLATDHTKYVHLTNNSGSGNRYAKKTINGVTSDNYTLEFDAFIKSGGHSSQITQLVIGTSDLTAGNSYVYDGNEYIFSLRSDGADSKDFYVAGTSDSHSATFNQFNNTWCHFKIDVKDKITYTISQNGVTLLQKSYNVKTGRRAACIFAVVGRARNSAYQDTYGQIQIDNIVVRNEPIDLSTYTFTQPGTLTVTAQLASSSYSPATATYTVETPYYKLYESPAYNTIKASEAASKLGGTFSDAPYTARWSNWNRSNAIYGENYVMVSSQKEGGYLDDDAKLYFTRMGSNVFHLVEGFGIGHNYTKGATPIVVSDLGDAQTIVYYQADLSRGYASKYDAGYTNANADGSWTYNLDGNTTFCKFIAYKPYRFLLGDLNHDGYVNITDVVLLVNHILGSDDGIVIEAEADINGDTMVNITDVVALTNIILGQ